jgi:hypothetical protein
LHQQLIVWIIC